MQALLMARLPYPPSSNRVARSARGGHYTPATVRAFRASVAATIHPGWGARWQPVLQGDLGAMLTLHPPLTKRGKVSQRRIDLDNAIKATLDALQHCGTIANDKQFTAILLLIGDGLQHGGIDVTIYRADDLRAMLQSSLVSLAP